MPQAIALRAGAQLENSFFCDFDDFFSSGPGGVNDSQFAAAASGALARHGLCAHDAAMENAAISRLWAAVRPAVWAAAMALSACLVRPAAGDYPDPARFEKAIEAFERQDAANPPPLGAVLCVGSSSMRLWHGAIRKDLAPLPIVPRGFGGSTMWDLLHFADRIVLPYLPRAAVIYEGDNDIAAGVSPERVRDVFLRLVAKIHGRLPETRIYCLSIKPSIARWKLWPAMRRANRLLAEACARDPRLVFVDVAAPMLGPDGRPRPEIFLKDNLHMNRKGYEIWRDALRPILLSRERP